MDENALPYSPNNPIMTKIIAIEESLQGIANQIHLETGYGEDNTDARLSLERVEEYLYDENDITDDEIAVYDPH